ncbi:MAG: hypothetical protein KAG61_04460 [Bacteriovoracaceae bacterium]|nr:hypothetical protein [Bacteriovoracaceae bacterium]
MVNEDKSFNPDAQKGRATEGLAALFLRPSTFFSNTALRNTEIPLGACAYLVGVAGALEKVTQQTSGFFVESWFGAFLAAILGGAFATILTWTVHSWFYKVRLHWSGAGEADIEDGRELFVYSTLVSAAPYIFMVIVEAVMYKSPIVAESAPLPPSGFIGLICLPWAVTVSYKGVRARFEQVSPWRARIWFIAAPALFYSAAILVATLAQ